MTERRTGRRLWSAGLLVLVLVLDAVPGAAGFWLGLWHGVITPITFVVSLFTDDVSIYEVRNSGNWYDFGFVLGIAAAFSGSASSARVARPRTRSR